MDGYTVITLGRQTVVNDVDDGDPAELVPSDPCEESVGSDQVATGRALERAAERRLATADADDRTGQEIRSACEQLAADRTNGEDLDDSIQQLRDLLARSAE